MKRWLRIDQAFDPATLVGIALAGILPTAFLLLISSFTLTGMSISLSDLLEEPHRERVRAQSRVLSSAIDRVCEEWRRGVRDAVMVSGSDLPIFSSNGAASLRDLAWFPERVPSEIVPVSDERGDLADSVLRSILHLEEPGERAEILAGVAALPPELEDELGFSYAIEAALRTDEAVLDPIRVLRIPALDRETLRAWRETIPGETVPLSGLPIPLRIEVTGEVAWGPRARLVADAPGHFEIVSPGVGSGAIVARFETDSFLHAVLESALAEREADGSVFTELQRFEDEANPREGRVWASWPLPPPFDRDYQLVTGTWSAEPPLPLAMLRRLEGVQLFGIGLVFVALAVAGSLYLGALASRRVRTSQEKDNFLRLVSHELRTPIASIRMISETLELGRVRSEEERQEFLDQLQKESGRLSDLVERVLEFGRGEAGSKPREVITDPAELVEETVEEFLAREREGDRPGNSEFGAIEVLSSQLFHPVVIDREAVTRVLQNLLSNARKYAPDSARVEVTVGEESRHLFISVRDEGPGLTRREQKRVFESFYRGEQGAQQPGFGLGLAYCQQVAKAHGGRLGVRSAPGRGTTFTLEIPLESARREGGESGSNSDR